MSVLLGLEQRKALGLLFLVLLFALGVQQAISKEATVGTKEVSNMPLNELRSTIKNLKASKKTCDIDYLLMLEEAVASYVNRNVLKEKEGVALLVKMSSHTNDCKSIMK